MIALSAAQGGQHGSWLMLHVVSPWRLEGCNSSCVLMIKPCCLRDSRSWTFFSHSVLTQARDLARAEPANQVRGEPPELLCRPTQTFIRDGDEQLI